MLSHFIDHGNSERVIILLHGTGGDARSMVSLGHMIDEEATFIGIDGDEFEQGMRRYFKRFPNGTFDIVSLEEKTKQLYENIQHLLTLYSLENSKVTLLGYSNGANIAMHLFKRFETDIDLALLLHPALGLGDVGFVNQRKLSLFLSTGKNDPYITESEFDQLLRHIDQSNINCTWIRHESGHQITREEIDQAKLLYASKILDNGRKE